MKLADRTIEVHSVGVFSANRFKVAQTSKMFNILSNSLYSDKVMAVIRELSTNAYDAHIAAGNPNPFLVRLPTFTDPNFTIRDYGTGLNQKDMEELYTTYGASNKNDSNDYVGCLGLGSKSPFAYTKSFTTSSYFNGTKYTYVAAMDESGVPTLNLLDITPTQEPNGLEISFAVKNSDFGEFSSKAVRVFHYFKQKPVILGGNLKDPYSNRDIIFNDDSWRLCKLNNNSDLFPNAYNQVDSKIIAIMGNIAYPVNISLLTGDENKVENETINRWKKSSAIKSDWKVFIDHLHSSSMYLELDFGIGELDMDPSREGLQYTKQVIKTLKDKIQEVYSDLKNQSTAAIANSKTLVEAIKNYNRVCAWNIGATWTDSNGKIHNISVDQDPTYTISSPKSLYVINYKTAGYRSRKRVCLTDTIDGATLGNYKNYYYGYNTNNVRDVKFFFCDTKNAETGKKIALEYCLNNNCFGYLLVDTQDSSKCREGFDDLIRDVGLENIENISNYKDLIKKTSSTRVAKGSVSDQDIFFIVGPTDREGLNYDYNSSNHLKKLSEQDLEDIMDSEEIVYVPITRYNSEDGYPAISMIRGIFDAEATKDIRDVIFDKDIKIYAIKNHFVDKLKNKGLNLVDFNSYLKTKLDLNKDAIAYSVKLQDLQKVCATSSDICDDNKTTISFFNHIVNIFGKDYKKYIKNSNLIKCVDDLFLLKFFATRDVFSSDYKNIVQQILVEKNSDIDLKTIRRNPCGIIVMINYLYAGKETVDEYLNIIRKDSKELSLDILSADSINKTIEIELDKSPVMKYILTGADASVNFGVKIENNPMINIGGYHYYYTNHQPKMSEDSVLLLRTQLGSLIS